ncbi:MAG: choice-of-anchor A family protein [Myxococcaceae bacterium]|nr:choice-of-anchor A family protein [Myxococcaceae bacterium]
MKDPSGNTGTSSVTRLVTMVDTLAPVLVLNGPATQGLECGTQYTDPGATATDQCFGNITQRVTRTGALNQNASGSYLLTYSVTDPAGQSAPPVYRTVNITDTQPPTLTVNGPLPQQLACGTQYTDPGATALDLCDGNLTPSITVSSNVNTSLAGQYTTSYTVKDRAGRTRTATRQVTVTGVEIRLSDYTVFVLQNYSGGRDVRGKVAAGGNITLTDFSVGQDVPSNNVARTLVAGSKLTLARGSVWGPAFYGSSYSGGATVTYHRGTVARGTPINFASRFTELRSLSSKLASLTPTGTTTRGTEGYIVLAMTGTNPKVNVFEVTASAINGINQMAISAPAGALVVINVRGTSATVQNFGFALSGGITASGILYNFMEATTLNAGSIGLQGTVLAPYANVTFNNGAWDGGIYALSLTGTAEGHLKALNDRASCQ